MFSLYCQYFHCKVIKYEFLKLGGVFHQFAVDNVYAPGRESISRSILNSHGHIRNGICLGMAHILRVYVLKIKNLHCIDEFNQAITLRSHVVTMKILSSTSSQKLIYFLTISKSCMLRMVGTHIYALVITILIVCCLFWLFWSYYIRP